MLPNIHIQSYTYYIYIIYYCSEGVADLIPHEDKMCIWVGDNMLIFFQWEGMNIEPRSKLFDRNETLVSTDQIYIRCVLKSTKLHMRLGSLDRLGIWSSWNLWLMEDNEGAQKSMTRLGLAVEMVRKFIDESKKPTFWGGLFLLPLYGVWWYFRWFITVTWFTIC